MRYYSIAFVLLFSNSAFAEVRIACVGDSLTDSDYPTFLEEMCEGRCQVKTWAKKGARMRVIDHLALKALESDFKPTHIVIYGGINDCLEDSSAFIKGISRGAWVGGYIPILANIAHERGIIPIAVTHHGWSRKSVAGNKCSGDFNKEVYESNVLRIVNTSELSFRGVLKKIYDGGDGLHLNRRGYRELARMVFAAIFPSGVLGC